MRTADTEDLIMKNTGVMCVVVDSSTGGGMRHVDLGNYFEHQGQRVLVTSNDLARRYGHLVDVPVYVIKPQSGDRHGK